MEQLAVAMILGARFLVAGAFVLAAAVAITHWAVRRGSLNAFGAWARFTRRWSDPLLHPLERRLVRGGANPQDAPLWLVGIAVIGGLVLIGAVNWLVDFTLSIYEGTHNGSALVIALHYLFELLKFALLIRVLSSWIAVSRYSRFMRFIYGLTDWLVEPIHRVLPPLGMFDFSPLVAYLVLSLAENLVSR